jgi:hypothetical protein
MEGGALRHCYALINLLQMLVIVPPAEIVTR